MNKSIKLLLIFSMLFCSLTYHKQADAGILKCARNIIITGAVLTCVYFAIKKFGESENENDSPEIKNLKIFAKKFTFSINDIEKTFNHSIKENLNIDFSKFNKKIVKVFEETKESIEKNIDNIILTPEQRTEKFKKKFEEDLQKMANGDKNIVAGGLDLLKKSAKFIENEFKNS